MNTQSERDLEEEVIEQLVQLGYEYVAIKDEEELLANLKLQLEKLNNIDHLSSQEFLQILNKLRKGSIYDKAKLLRQPKIDYTRDDGRIGYITLLNTTTADGCERTYQVTNKITINGKSDNRYAVTILINGLPLVQIELKRQGLEFKEAFEQISRHAHNNYSLCYGLFNYIQLFIIINGVNIKYYVNNKTSVRSSKQTFYWTNENNETITQLRQFAYTFLDTYHISKMICKYIVLNETYETLMVLRPYQYYAVEAIIKRVNNTEKDGYIWHTTGSGKTLTSFKASQILAQFPNVEKVVFVVDRKDLDYQTTKDFNSFSDGTENTKMLVNQFINTDIKLIVTTIQRLDVAIKSVRHQRTMEQFKKKKMIFIFDECHRSKFGNTHKRIKTCFLKAQIFGFTGTPIFEKNAICKKSSRGTTEYFFGLCLHKYGITEAIRDENVLKFSVEYIRRVKKKDKIADINVEDIDKKEEMEASGRLENITDYIIANHRRKTHNKEFTAMLCVPNISTLIEYYDIFKKKAHDLKIASIFSCKANKNDKEAKAFIIDEEELDAKLCIQSREKLDECIGDYNKMYGTNFSTKDSQSFYNYYNDISKRVKNRNIDILLIVNMFLTGFDSQALNTLYVDKNLNYHGLIQAYSRTNRIFNELKSQGNIVCFRNLKKATDDAITLFANEEAKNEIIMPPYEDFTKNFNIAVAKLLEITPSVDTVNNLVDEEAELSFVIAFRQIIRLINTLNSFSEFSYEDLDLDEQGFNDYKSKYLDLYDKVKSNRELEKTSILDDVNFELELIYREETNVAYILQLLLRIKSELGDNKEQIKKAINSLLLTEVNLRSKRELIEKFMSEIYLQARKDEKIEQLFYRFIESEKVKALKELGKNENLYSTKLKALINNYLFVKKEPLRDEIIGIMRQRPSLKERKIVAERIIAKIKKYISVFVDGV